MSPIPIAIAFLIAMVAFLGFVAYLAWRDRLR